MGCCCLLCIILLCCLLKQTIITLKTIFDIRWQNTNLRKKWKRKKANRRISRVSLTKLNMRNLLFSYSVHSIKNGFKKYSVCRNWSISVFGFCFLMTLRFYHRVCLRKAGAYYWSISITAPKHLFLLTSESWCSKSFPKLAIYKRGQMSLGHWYNTANHMYLGFETAILPF